MAAPTLKTEDKYSLALKAFLNESKGGVLRKFCQYATTKGAATYEFSRVDKATAMDGTVSLFGSNNGDSAGSVTGYKATLSIISAPQKVKKEELEKTELGIKNSWIESIGNAVLVKEDLAIMTAIKAKDATLKKVDIKSGGLTTKANIAKIIGKIMGARAKMDNTVATGTTGVAVAMNTSAWEALSESDYVLNADYEKAFGGEGKGTFFFGAEVLFTDAVGDKDIYIIPSGLVGLVENTDGREAVANYYATDNRSWHLQASETIGAVCIEPANITKITYLA